MDTADCIRTSHRECLLQSISLTYSQPTLQVLVNDIQAHQSSVDTLNDAGRQLIESGRGSAEASSTQDKLSLLNKRWRDLLQKVCFVNVTINVLKTSLNSYGPTKNTSIERNFVHIKDDIYTLLSNLLVLNHLNVEFVNINWILHHYTSFAPISLSNF